MTQLPYSPKEVGNRITALREALGLKQAEMARAIGVLQAELSAWETGVRRPSIAKAKPLVDRYHITLDWLFLGDSGNLPHRVVEMLHAPKRATQSPDQG